MRRKGFHSLIFLDIKKEKSPLATSVTWSSLGSLDRVPKMAVSTGLSVAEEGEDGDQSSAEATALGVSWDG